MRASKGRSLIRKLRKHTQPITSTEVKKARRGVTMTRRDMKDPSHPMAEVAPPPPVMLTKRGQDWGYTEAQAEALAKQQRQREGFLSRQAKVNERLFAKLVGGKALICARCGFGHPKRGVGEKVKPCCESFSNTMQDLLGEEFLDFCTAFVAAPTIPQCKTWYTGPQILNAPWFQALQH